MDECETRNLRPTLSLSLADASRTGQHRAGGDDRQPRRSDRAEQPEASTRTWRPAASPMATMAGRVGTTSSAVAGAAVARRPNRVVTRRRRATPSSSSNRRSPYAAIARAWKSESENEQSICSLQRSFLGLIPGGSGCSAKLPRLAPRRRAGYKYAFDESGLVRRVSSIGGGLRPCTDLCRRLPGIGIAYQRTCWHTTAWASSRSPAIWAEATRHPDRAMCCRTSRHRPDAARPGTQRPLHHPASGSLAYTPA